LEEIVAKSRIQQAQAAIKYIATEISSNGLLKHFAGFAAGRCKKWC
jgi:hypothetical protein